MPPETIVGRYRVIREVGRGGMGAVWLCVDERLGREVAVKQLGGLPGESSPHVARALREARSSAALNHPHVVAIFDAVEDGERVWLVMEHLASRNLSRLISDEGPLAPARLAAIGAQVADGLAAAHEQRTVHRDVKPGNILVTDDDLAKISDFGIARTLGDEQLTQTGMVMGTPLYFSPQLARGADPVPADDVWALGATLFSAVEGEPPWPHRSNAIAMLTHIATEPPAAPRRAGPLTDVIRRMMDPEPSARPSMADVAEELRSVAAGAVAPEERTRPVPAVPLAPDPVPAPARRRGSVLLAVLVVLGLVVAGGLALLLGPWRDGARDEAARGPDPAPTRTPGPRESEDPESEDRESPDPGPSEQAGLGPEEFITDYYASLPSDPETAWSLLAPSYQEEVGGFEEYAGFWRTVETVSTDATTLVGDDQVDVELTYDGSERETRRITVEPDGDGWLIVADEVV